jgi:hypothetical protein
MSRALGWWLSLVLAGACARPPAPCTPVPLPDTEQLLSPVPGLIGAGHTVQRVVDSPIGGCLEPGAELGATFVITGPGNEPLEGTLDAVQPASGGAQAFITFTPPRPGTWTLSVSFEPSLGTRTVALDVLPTLSAADGVTFIAPPGLSCSSGPWPVGEHHVLCDEPAGQVALVDLEAPDGGVTLLDGQQVAVVEDVVWKLDGAGQALERWLFTDGGLTLTHRWQGFVFSTARGLHTRDLAVRAASPTHMRAVTTDNLDTTVLFGRTTVGSGVFWFDQGTSSLDDLSLVFSTERLVALSSSAAWFRGSDGRVVIRSPPTSVTGRPVEVPVGTIEPLPRGPLVHVPLVVRLEGALYVQSTSDTFLAPDLPFIRLSGQTLVFSLSGTGQWLLLRR